MATGAAVPSAGTFAEPVQAGRTMAARFGTPPAENGLFEKISSRSTG